MNEEQRRICKMLREMSDEEAAAWLKRHYPGDDARLFWDAVFLLAHRSWRKKQRDKLLDYYLGYLKVHHVPASTAFEPLVRVAPIWRLCKVLTRHLPDNEKHLDLLAYNGLPVLKYSCKTKKDRQAVEDLECRLKDGMRKAD
ncbi:MAG: hypothetical protein DSY80_05880 [Desulfocapsa sp.]|nr:MAG: hypothetical protein DSY80_05880 [Desulfocapsa sp.]